MTRIDFEQIVRRVLTRLGAGHVREVLAGATVDSLSEDAFNEVIEACQVTPIPPPEGVDLKLTVYPMQSPNAQWGIDVPIWTREEGQSELILQLWIRLDDARGPQVTLQSLVN
jgi:hypothetical protein